jgi:hypothetical protein
MDFRVPIGVGKIKVTCPRCDSEEFLNTGKNKTKGSDLVLRLKFTLEELAEKVTKTILLKRLVKCKACNGTGSVSVTKSPPESYSNSPCKVCQGEGRQQDTVKLKINIPGGASKGEYITLKGDGDVGQQGGPPGDVIVLIQEKKHSFFTRLGDDIVFELSISYNQAFLGDKIKIPTLKSDVNLVIPGGTQSGQIIRLRGVGLPHLRGNGHGHQLVKITVRKETVPSLSQLRGMKPINFEHRVAEMYSKLGCKKEITDKAAGDGGIDIILRKMGKKYLVQCKRYSEKNTIKVGVVRELMGVVASENADGGWVVTTSTFTKAAKDFAKKNKILKLIDSSDLMDDMKKSLA